MFASFSVSASLTAIIGYCILLGNTDPTHRPGVSYVGVFFAAGGIYPAVALVLSALSHRVIEVRMRDWLAVKLGGGRGERPRGDPVEAAR